MAEVEQKFCPVCKRTKRIDTFYKTNNHVKYPDGYLNECKECATMMIDNWDSKTFTPMLEECDVPYIPDEWNKLLASFAKDPSKVTGLTIIGRYLGKMQLKQFRDYRWKDNEFIQQLADHKTEEAMKRQGFEAAEIATVLAENKEVAEAPEGWTGPAAAATPEPEPAVDYFDQNNTVEAALTEGLTEEDKTYLLIKWGKSYKPSEWVQLEQLYQEMMQSYDITAAGDINSLKLACKSSLKANQLLDMGDIDGAQKVSKMYDALMKSGKWTAATNKTESAEDVDSVGEIVELCEKDGFIPRYYIDTPGDKADKIIIDNQKYLHDLVDNESGLGNLIELAIQNIEKEKKQIAEAGERAEEASKTEEDALFDYDINVVTTDDDIKDFNEFIDAEAALDEESEE